MFKIKSHLKIKLKLWSVLKQVIRRNLRNDTFLSQFKYVMLLLSVSLFSLLFILKVPSLVLQCMADKVKDTRDTEKKLINLLFPTVSPIVH